MNHNLDSLKGDIIGHHMGHHSMWGTTLCVIRGIQEF